MNQSDAKTNSRVNPTTSRPTEPIQQNETSIPPQLTVSRAYLDTSDPDEAAIAFSRIYPGTRLRPLDKKSFHCSLRTTTIGPVTFVDGDWPYGIQLDTVAIHGRYLLVRAAEGSRAEAVVENRALSVVHQELAILFPPEQSGSLRIPVGNGGRSIIIEQSALEAHFAMITGHVPRHVIPFDLEVNLGNGGGATLDGLVRLLRYEIDHPALSPLVRPRFCDALLTALVTIPHFTDPRLLDPPPRVAPRIVRRAEEFMAAHVHDPIGLADIVSAAGAPARSLQAAFKAARGMTPMEFLKHQRLEQARMMLMAALPETTVAGVAIAMGFRSAERFSVEYAKLFRESPSETLSRSRPTKQRPSRVR